jgi:2-iminobutanoate/2-iminopropanoate deaminase
MNEVYSRYLGQRSPARTTIEAAALPKGARVEIDLIAAY